MKWFMQCIQPQLVMIHDTTPYQRQRHMSTGAACPGLVSGKANTFCLSAPVCFLMEETPISIEPPVLPYRMPAPYVFYGSIHHLSLHNLLSDPLCCPATVPPPLCPYKRE